MQIGAKDRLVQIAGSDEKKIGKAKELIAETIRLNKSPVPPPSPSGDAQNVYSRTDGEYGSTLSIGEMNYIKIKGNDPELTKVKFVYWFRMRGSGIVNFPSLLTSEAAHVLIKILIGKFSGSSFGSARLLLKKI